MRIRSFTRTGRAPIAASYATLEHVNDNQKSERPYGKPVKE